MAVTAASSRASLEYYARISAEQEKINTQAASLERATGKVETSLTPFDPTGLFEYLYEEDKTSSVFRGFALNAVRSLVKNCNELTAAGKSADRLGDEGKALLEKVKAVLAGPAGGIFREMGIGLNRATGELRFDETRFNEKILADPQGVRQAIMGRDGLGPVMQRVIEAFQSRAATSYFNSSFIINA